MTIYTDRIVLVFPIAAKNRQAAASLQTLEITESGKEFETLVPLDPALVSQYASEFNLPLLEKVTELEADLATTSSQLEAVTAAKQALVDDVLVKTEQLALADSEYKLLETKVAFLESIRTYNPRILKGKAFYKRISQSDMEILLTSEIPQLVTVGKTILAYRDNDWPIIIDSDDFQTLVGYVYMSGTFDTEEVASIMRDATRDEAYIT